MNIGTMKAKGKGKEFRSAERNLMRVSASKHLSSELWGKLHVVSENSCGKEEGWGEVYRGNEDLVRPHRCGATYDKTEKKK